MIQLKTLHSPEFSLTLHYPDPTPRGSSVDVVERQSDHSYRLHLLSTDSDEIYFEVGKYPHLSSAAAQALFQHELTAQYPDVTLDPVRGMVLAGKNGRLLTARWPTRERTIIFVPHDGAVYRLIFNPASPINHQILNTVTFHGDRWQVHDSPPIL